MTLEYAESLVVWAVVIEVPIMFAYAVWLGYVEQKKYSEQSKMLDKDTNQ